LKPCLSQVLNVPRHKIFISGKVSGTSSLNFHNNIKGLAAEYHVFFLHMFIRLFIHSVIYRTIH